MGHVLDYPHQLPDGIKGEVDNDGKHNGEPVKGVHSPCPVMYQQTKGTKGRCRMNPWVSMEKNNMYHNKIQTFMAAAGKYCYVGFLANDRDIKGMLLVVWMLKNKFKPLIQSTLPV